jgi:sulfate transporter 4
LQLRENLFLDVITGISIAFMVVPQGLSYAKLANLPSVWGLYGAMIPNMMYSLFGSSRHLAVGPVAVTSLLLGNALHTMIPESKAIEDPNNPEGPEQRIIQDHVNRTAMQVCGCSASDWLLGLPADVSLHLGTCGVAGFLVSLTLLGKTCDLLTCALWYNTAMQVRVSMCGLVVCRSLATH